MRLLAFRHWRICLSPWSTNAKGLLTECILSRHGIKRKKKCYFLAALIADKVEMKYKELRRKKRMAELASDIWSDWHQAQANRQPSQYKDVLNYHDLPKEAKKPSS